MNSIGIDPGVRNLGIAITDEKGQFLYSVVIDPKVIGFKESIRQAITLGEYYEVKYVCIERFVAYENIMSKATEDILMLIGGLRYAFLEELYLTPLMLRAIEWKPKLCKHLVKKFKFSNPSNSFDKKYSLAAAKCITGIDSVTDHEGDAVCLSYMWNVK